MMTIAPAATPPPCAVHEAERRAGAVPLDETEALRGALAAETRIAEAMAQRSRTLVALVEAMAGQALAESRDIPEAQRRLAALGRGLREGLDAGEAAGGALQSLAERTLAAFEGGAGPRIALSGPPAILDRDARRLLALVLFELASRSARFGALAAREGRVALDWMVGPGGALCLVWREFGGAPGADRRRRVAGSALVALVSELAGVAPRIEATPFGLRVEIALPGRVVRPGPVPPARALVAVADPAAAVTLCALLTAQGAGEVAIVRTIHEAHAAIAAGGIDLVLADRALGGTVPATLPRVRIAAARARAQAGCEDDDNAAVLRLPAGVGRLRAAIEAARAAAEQGTGGGTGGDAAR